MSSQTDDIKTVRVKHGKLMENLLHDVTITDGAKETCAGGGFVVGL